MMMFHNSVVRMRHNAASGNT